MSLKLISNHPKSYAVPELAAEPPKEIDTNSIRVHGNLGFK